MQRKYLIGCIASGMALAAPWAGAADHDDFASAVSDGDASVSLRYRYEYVDQDSSSLQEQQANASTARLRLNYRTGRWNSLSLFGELDYVGHILATDFDSGGGTTPDKQGQFPVVADPKGADLNQLYLDLNASDRAQIRLGRQRILLDNQRFVGGVGWRQNEQTYDGLTLRTDAVPKGAVSYTFLNRVKRIFGEDSPAGSDRVNGHLLNGKFGINEEWSVVPYFYHLDYRDPARVANSSTTFGARLEGGFPAGEGKIAIVAEIARQSDAADNPVNYSANYVHAEFTFAMDNGVSLGIGYENLGSDGGTAAFRTPLATLHKFQGWADKFLATPATGIDDVYATVKFNAVGWSFTGVYHDFAPDSGDGSFGDEFDVSAAHKLSDNYSILLKGAFFSGDAAGFDDTTKLWAMLTANF